MLRSVLLLAAVVFPIATTGAIAQPQATNDLRYARANARLARTVPHYPGARLLVEETIHGEVGVIPFQAVQRIYAVAPAKQPAVTRFYKRRLGTTWWQRRASCLVSASRLVIAVVSTNRQRLGVLVDSRGSRRCYDLTGLLGDLVDLGYPDP